MVEVGVVFSRRKIMGPFKTSLSGTHCSPEILMAARHIINKNIQVLYRVLPWPSIEVVATTYITATNGS